MRFQTAVAARMIDRDPGELREPDHRPLVDRREFASAELLGEIQVPERLARDHHRNSEEAPHWRVAGRKPIGPRVIPDARNPQRPGVADQFAEHTAPRRRRSDLAALGLINARRDEPRQRGPGLIKNADRGIASPGQLSRRLKHTTEHPLKVQIAQHTASNIKDVR